MEISKSEVGEDVEFSSSYIWRVIPSDLQFHSPAYLSECVLPANRQSVSFVSFSGPLLVMSFFQSS